MSNRLTALMGGIMLACFVSISRLDHFTRDGTIYIPLLLIAFIAYGLLCWRVIRNPAISIGLILLAAVLFRLPLLTTTPTLSTDVWRYLHDGRLITMGINPYAYRVDAPELLELRTDLHPRIEHQWMASPYPPAAQGIFGLTYAILPESPTAMQLVFTLFDLLTVLVLMHLLRLLDRPPAWMLIYAWNPLIVIEFAHGAHVDSLMTLLILLALVFTMQGQQRWSAIMLALATLTKFIPALLLPVLLKRWGIKNSLLYGVIVGLAFVPFLSAGISQDGTGIFGAARIYASEWKTNDGLFYWLVEGLQTYTADPIQTARLITMSLLMLASGAVLLYEFYEWKWIAPSSASERMMIEAVLLISLYLLLISAMFPWYLTWLIALLPLLPLRSHPAARWWAAGWLYFSAAVNFSYLFYLDPASPGEYAWIRWLEYIPLYILLGIAGLLALLPVLLQRLPQRENQHKSAAARE